MTLQKRHWIIIEIVLGLLALLAALLIIVIPAVTTNAAPAKLSIGTYTVETRFITGPQAGTTEIGTLTFNADNTVTSNYPSIQLSGKGAWWITNGSVEYSFREKLPNNSGDVQVVHIVTNRTGPIKSQGRGIIYNSSGSFITAVETENTLTLV